MRWWNIFVASVAVGDGFAAFSFIAFIFSDAGQWLEPHGRIPLPADDAILMLSFMIANFFAAMRAVWIGSHWSTQEQAA